MQWCTFGLEKQHFILRTDVVGCISLWVHLNEDWVYCRHGEVAHHHQLPTLTGRRINFAP